MSQRNFTVILPAAGKSNRFGGGDKLLSDINGSSVLQRAVTLFASRSDVFCIVIAAPPDRHDAYRRHLEPVLKSTKLGLVQGGSERWESVYNALISSHVQTDYVAVHDAARPLTPKKLIDAVFSAAVEHGAALPLLPEPATLKKMGADGVVLQTVDRAGLFQAQTPQCFGAGILRDAFERLIHEKRITMVTDDAQVVEWTGGRVIGVPGSAANIKITTPDDLILARALAVQSG
jgi:2-C-methyl-D-erythritol 4-phosphate cytidylyltransferase